MFRLRLICLLTIAALVPARAALAETIKLVYELVENPPRYYGTTAEIPETKPGATIDIFREVARRLGITLQMSRVPWKRGLFMIETGEADGIFHASYKKDRTAFGVYPTLADGATPDETRAVFFQAYSFYALRDSAVSFDGSMLKGAGRKSVAVTRGYSVIRELKTLKIPYEEERTQVLNLAKLENGRVAAYAELDNMIAPYLTPGGKFANVAKLSPPISVKAYYLLFSKKFYRRQRHLAEAFWNEIHTINTSPLLDEILDRYR